MANSQPIFLLLFSLSAALGNLQNVPSYEEYLRMAAGSINQRLSNNLTHVNFDDFKSPFHDAKGNNYLGYLSPMQNSYKNSEDPLFRKKLNIFSVVDICAMTQPNVSIECCSSVQSIYNAVYLQEQWAIQIIDAMGKVPSGIFHGNMFFSGSYDECLTTTVPVSGNEGNISFHTKYCQIGLPLAKNSPWAIKYAVCAPDTCKPEEINFLFHEVAKKIPIHIKVDLKTTVSCPEKKDFDGKAIFSLVICSFFALFLLTGTLYDIIFIQLDLKGKLSERESSFIRSINYGSGQLDDDADERKPLISNQTPKSSSWLERFLLCFSIHKNATKLFKTDLASGSLTSIHGMRFISMTWVILGHTYVFGMSIWSNAKDSLTFMSRFTFQVIANATVSVDTFFMLSGLLVTYGVMHLMASKDGKMNWVYFYVHRFWRLTPPYMLVMMVYVPLFQYWGDGPYWPVNGVELNYCKDTWWYNLLYINNFNKTECMAWAWYLANDMQFYVISPLILIFLYRKPKIGYGILTALMLAQLITCGVLMKVYKYKGLFSPGYFNDIYVKPYTRIGSYLVGMFYGYLLYRTKCKMILNKYLVAMAWLIAIGSSLAVLYGLYDTYHGTVLSADVFALYTTVHRIVWAIAVGWVIYACVSGYGGFVNTILSWKPLIPLSRLTYCAYLVHPVIMDAFYFHSRYPIYLSDYEAIYLFFGHVVMAYTVGFGVSMAFEAPMIALESLVRGKNNQKK